MQVSKQKINKNLETQINQLFLQLLVDISHPKEADVVLGDLLTETERQVITKRLAIAMFLDKGRSYENIRQTLKVSSATIASVQENMGNPGIQLALRKIKAEAWADAWAEKISSFVDKLKPSKSK